MANPLKKLTPLQPKDFDVAVMLAIHEKAKRDKDAWDFQFKPFTARTALASG